MRHRYYKYSINLGPFRINNNSKIYDIPEGRSAILPGLIYSFTTILLGWWSFNLRRPVEHFRNSLEALHINFSGGEDVTNLISDEDFEGVTNYVWNNLHKETKDKITKIEIEKVLELNEEYIERNDQSIDDAEFIKLGLSRFRIHHLKNEDIDDVLNALNLYTNNLIEEN